ncbi:cytochrome P450 [Streptacidiphilus cavernicola]|uniref:Cytochrome P450 n=1 Tax=Streptacidiphilus cavernicola TaxID=3342716 RepID=A0ABV6VX56_9ACTN
MTTHQDAPPSCPAHDPGGQAGPGAPADPSGEARGPGGVVRMHSPVFQSDPAELYRALRREHGPVAPILLDGDIPAWLVLGYREVHFVTTNSDLFARDSRRWHAWDRIPSDWPLLPYVFYTPSVLFKEGAEHRRRSGAITDVLSQVDQFELRATAEKVADTLIDGFAPTGSAELMADYAAQVPLRVVGGLFGLALEQTLALERDMVDSLDDGPGAVEAYGRIHEAMSRLLERGRRSPGPDVASRMLAHPAGLEDEEIVQDMISIMAAGQQPTCNWIGNTLRLMLTDDRFAVTLSGGRRSVGQALNEVLWADTPTQNFIGRWAARDTVLAGKQIAAGDCLVLGLAAANTDPEVQPDFTAGSVGNQAHLSFSHGEHRCPVPAPEMAEVIARAAVEVLLDRLPDVALTVPTEQLDWRPSIWMRGVSALPVAFTSA